MPTPWKKYHPLSDKNAFICLVDVMGNDNAIVQAARASYDGFSQGIKITDKTKQKFPDYRDVDSICKQDDGWYDVILIDGSREAVLQAQSRFSTIQKVFEAQLIQDRHTTRYLMNHSHTTPFEMVEIKFMVQVPMDCWRQWVRHRTANINEYSTRYMEALDFFQVTQPSEWRLQSTDNKQGSSGFLEEWPAYNGDPDDNITKEIYKDEEDPIDYTNSYNKADYKPGEVLSHIEQDFHKAAITLYKQRLRLGVAKEQARKDLPLSTYTRAYWKCDLHNIFNFLRLRMDSHAQLEIRSFANCMFEIVKEICPVACEAFEDYVLHAKKFSRMEMEYLQSWIQHSINQGTLNLEKAEHNQSMTNREWKEFLEKLV